MTTVESNWYQLSLHQNTQTDSGHNYPHLPSVKTTKFVSRREEQLGYEAGHSYALTRSQMWGATSLHIPYKPYDVHKYKFTFPVFITSVLHKTESIVAIKFIKNSQLYEKLIQHTVYYNGLIKAYIH